jgi:hypothetical protein
MNLQQRLSQEGTIFSPELKPNKENEGKIF